MKHLSVILMSMLAVACEFDQTDKGEVCLKTVSGACQFRRDDHIVQEKNGIETTILVAENTPNIYSVHVTKTGGEATVKVVSDEKSVDYDEAFDTTLFVSYSDTLTVDIDHLNGSGEDISVEVYKNGVLDLNWSVTSGSNTESYSVY